MLDNIIKIERLKPWPLDNRLCDVSLQLDPGTCLMILGSVGTGKSAFLNSFVGRNSRATGSIYFKNINLIEKKPYDIAQLGITYVPQNRGLFFDLTVEENFRLSWEITKSRSSKNWKLLRMELLDIAPQIKDIMKKKSGILSGGQQRLVSILRAWISKPMVAIIDEPSGGLDVSNKIFVKNLIASLTSSGAIVIIAEQTNNRLKITPDIIIGINPGKPLSIERNK